ncbi:hypothetical protein M0804_009627 [Polistes exclamans]|nr:hypothetical protein M0804_009627 [Polistes exclamans]
MVHLSRKHSSEEDQRANSHDEDKVSRWTVSRVPSGSTGVHQGACWFSSFSRLFPKHDVKEYYAGAYESAFCVLVALVHAKKRANKQPANDTGITELQHAFATDLRVYRH